MGLDGVELVMAVEEKFGISISDEEAQTTVTVGDMKRLVRTKLQVSNETTCRTQQAFHLIRRAAIAQFGVPRRDITLDTPLDRIVPRVNRQTKWHELELSLDGVTLPELSRPLPVQLLMTAVILSTLVVGFWYAGLHPSRFGTAAAVAVLAGIVVGWFSMRVTRPLKTRFSTGYQQVRDIVRFVVGRYPQLLGDSVRTTWSDEAIWSLLCEIIIEQLGITRFDENSRFIEDLDLG